MLAEELKVLEDTGNGIKALYCQAQSVVHGGGPLSAAFNINIGVKEGCPASPSVFFLFFYKVWDFIDAHIPPYLLGYVQIDLKIYFPMI